jgi:hypothetical protein
MRAYWRVDKCGDVATLLGDLELHWAVRLVLHNHGARRDRLALRDIQDAQAYQVTATQLAINSELEQRQITGLFGKLEPYSDRPKLFEFQRSLVTNEPAFVPRNRCPGIFSMKLHESLLQ